MSNLRQLLQMFMKPDKKKIPETPIEKNETQNQSQKNDINDIKDQNVEPSKIQKTTVPPFQNLFYPLFFLF